MTMLFFTIQPSLWMYRKIIRGQLLFYKTDYKKKNSITRAIEPLYYHVKARRYNQKQFQS